MKKLPQESWEIDFDKQYDELYRNCIGYYNIYLPREVKDFIQQTLTSDRQRVVEKIDLMWLDKEKTRYDCGWNSALGELEARLKLLDKQ
jgi:hypothetical protein